MKLRVDTNAVIWAATTPERLTRRALAAIQDLENPVTVSVVSLWEIAIKMSIGRLSLGTSIEEFIEVHVPEMGLGILPLETRHLIAAAALPLRRRDPFDRMLVAQA